MKSIFNLTKNGVMVIAFLGALLLMGISINNKASITIPATDPIGVNVNMGSGPNCITSRRICTAQSTAQRKRQNGVDLFGEMSVNDNNELVMKFPTSEVSPKVANEQFKDDLFLLTESFNLPADIVAEMGLKNNYQIEAGSYDVQVVKGFYVVTLDLSTTK